MQQRQAKFTSVEVEIAEIVVGLNVTWLVLQRQREIVQRLPKLSQILIDDAEIAISLGNILTVTYRFDVRLGRFWVALFVKQQRLSKRAPQSGEVARSDAAKEVYRSLQCGLNLANAVTQRAQFAHAAELCERLKVENVVVGFRTMRGLNDSLFGPAADGALAQPEQLFDFLYGIV